MVTVNRKEYREWRRRHEEWKSTKRLLKWQAFVQSDRLDDRHDPHLLVLERVWCIQAGVGLEAWAVVNIPCGHSSLSPHQPNFGAMACLKDGSALQSPSNFSKNARTVFVYILEGSQMCSAEQIVKTKYVGVWLPQRHLKCLQANFHATSNIGWDCC